MISELFQWSFWPSIFAFLAVAIAFYVLGDFVVYTMSRYRERYLEEASTELDDILLQLPAGRVMDCSLAASAFVAFLSVIILMAVTGDFVWLTSIFVGLGSGAPDSALIRHWRRWRRVVNTLFRWSSGC
ncbi:MAG: hypothetical protein RRY34_03755 [Victivallaceae bacterium]